MFTLPTDIQKIIMEFLEPKEIKEIYGTCKSSNVMFEELTKYTNFIINAKVILTEQQLEWFNTRNIKLKLLETYKNINGDQLWYKNGKMHRDNGPAVIRVNGDKYWYKNGVSYVPN